MAVSKGAVTIKIKANGTDLANPGVKGLSISQQANAVSWAELVLVDGDIAQREFKLSSDPNYAPGVEMEIEMGHDADNLEQVFKGIVVRHQIKARKQGGTQLHLELKHVAVKMTHLRKARHFLDKDDKAILETLTGDSGLDISIDGDFQTTHERMIQYNVSDWDFMVLRAEANGCLVYTELDGVVVARPEVKASGAPKATLGDNIYEFEAELESRDQFSGGNAIGWDHANFEPMEQEAAAPSGVEEGGKPKATEMASALSEGSFKLRHPGDLPDTELSAWSSSKLQRSLLSKLRGRLQMEGDASMKPGATIVLAGLSEAFNGPAFVSAVRHHINNGQWLTDLELGLEEQCYLTLRPEVVEAPAGGLLGPMRGLQIGTVKEIKDDPGASFRVQVKMPMVDDTEDGIWCRVSHPDAGASHTVFFQPAVGDEVVLGFLNEDPRHAIILGSLHNKDANKPPIEGNEEYKKKGIVTAEGLMLTFDDEKKAVILETPAGKKITVDEDEGVIRLEDENRNKIELSKDGITIESGKDIILKATGDISVSGINIEQSANAQFKAEGSAGIEVSSSAIAVLKGAMVQIN